VIGAAVTVMKIGTGEEQEDDLTDDGKDEASHRMPQLSRRNHERLAAPAHCWRSSMPSPAIGGSYAAGFADLDQEVALDRLPVQGTWQDWLSGVGLEIGPGVPAESRA
jgi:hypothetical protein